MSQLQLPPPAHAAAARGNAVRTLSRAASALAEAVASAHRKERILAAADPTEDEEDIQRRLHRLDLLAEAASVIGNTVADHVQDIAGD